MEGNACYRTSQQSRPSLLKHTWSIDVVWMKHTYSMDSVWGVYQNALQTTFITPIPDNRIPFHFHLDQQAKKMWVLGLLKINLRHAVFANQRYNSEIVHYYS